MQDGANVPTAQALHIKLLFISILMKATFYVLSEKDCQFRKNCLNLIDLSLGHTQYFTCTAAASIMVRGNWAVPAGKPTTVHKLLAFLRIRDVAQTFYNG